MSLDFRFIFTLMCLDVHSPKSVTLHVWLFTASLLAPCLLRLYAVRVPSQLERILQRQLRYCDTVDTTYSIDCRCCCYKDISDQLIFGLLICYFYDLLLGEETASNFPQSLSLLLFGLSHSP